MNFFLLVTSTLQNATDLLRLHLILLVPPPPHPPYWCCQEFSLSHWLFLEDGIVPMPLVTPIFLAIQLEALAHLIAILDPMEELMILGNIQSFHGHYHFLIL